LNVQRGRKRYFCHDETHLSRRNVMKAKLVVVVLSMLLGTGLAAGCAQTAATPAPQKPTASAAVPAVSQTAVPPVQTTDAVKPADNTAAVPANQPATAAEITKIGDILQNPATYGGKVVTVKGKIVSECGSGCWFTLQDANAVIYIDLAPNNMVIPQKKGSAAKVTGEIVRDGTDVYMVGSKVDF
jgi:ABC-type transport system substrate-binding protein